MTSPTPDEPRTFTDFLRQLFAGILTAIARTLHKVGITANGVTLIGFVGNIIAGVLIGFGKLTWGGLVALLVTPLDAVDGTLARLTGEGGSFGAFFDSVTDRYSEIAIYFGLLVYFSGQNNWRAAFLVFAAALGSVMVSYLRARAEALGFSAKVGLLTRAERYIILIPGIVFHIPEISLWILAILTHFTALQRFAFVQKQSRIATLEKDRRDD